MGCFLQANLCLVHLVDWQREAVPACGRWRLCYGQGPTRVALSAPKAACSPAPGNPHRSASEGPPPRWRCQESLPRCDMAPPGCPAILQLVPRSRTTRPEEVPCSEVSDLMCRNSLATQLQVPTTPGAQIPRTEIAPQGIVLKGQIPAGPPALLTSAHQVRAGGLLMPCSSRYTLKSAGPSHLADLCPCCLARRCASMAASRAVPALAARRSSTS